jgi:hypothetical protein
MGQQVRPFDRPVRPALRCSDRVEGRWCGRALERARREATPGAKVEGGSVSSSFPRASLNPRMSGLLQIFPGARTFGLVPLAASLSRVARDCGSVNQM